MLESALAVPKNLLAYSKMPVSLPDLPQRTLLASSGTIFLSTGTNEPRSLLLSPSTELNGIEINAPAESTYLAFFNLAAGKLSEDGLTQWLEQNAVAT